MKSLLVKVVSLLLLAYGFFLTLLLIFGALLWLNSGLGLGVRGYLVGSLLLFLGSYTSYKIFIRFRRYLSTSSESHFRKPSGSTETLRVALALVVLFTILGLTGFYSWVDSYFFVPKVRYPFLFLSILFFPMIFGSTLLSPISIHFEEANATWAISFLGQIPTILQLAFISWIADSVVKLKGARKRGWRDAAPRIGAPQAC